MRTEHEFRALLVLLADEEERVSSAARKALLEEREASLPYLEEASESPDPHLRGRARLLLEDLRLALLEDQWRQYLSLPDDDLDLKQGCMLLSQMPAPADAASAQRFLAGAADMVQEHMKATGGLTALGEVLFDNLNFRGGEFRNPDHHYLSSVLERRVGVPILLATVYVLVGRRAGLPVFGVAMPGHYLARYETEDGPLFIDCFNRGRVYGQATLKDLLSGKKGRVQPRALAPVGNRFTLYRMLNNLEQVYMDRQERRMASVVRRFRSLLGSIAPRR